MPLLRSVDGGRLALTSKAQKTLLARLTGEVDTEARDLGYRIVGLRGVDLINPSRGVVWVQLTRGSVVASCDGLDSFRLWVPLLIEAQATYREERARVRALDS